MSSIQHQQMTIRQAVPADREALVRLAERDSAALPEGELLIGEIGGVPLAAVAIASGATIADPFKPTAELVALLRTRVEQMRGARGRRLRVVARSPALAARARSTA